jgi:translation initiation factor IF-3
VRPTYRPTLSLLGWRRRRVTTEATPLGKPPGAGFTLRLEPASSRFFVCSAAASEPSLEGRAIKEQRVRVNDQIRISPVRLIGADGEQVGIVSLDEARQRAEDAGLDLVEVAPEARPPVCKLMDYGKYRYEEQRKAREARKKQHTVSIKEVKYRPGIEDHDYEFKTRHVRRFLEDGDKVKVTMMFRGRQMSHPELGLEVLQRVAAAVEDLGKIESQPTREGRTMSMVIVPLKER